MPLNLLALAYPQGTREALLFFKRDEGSHRNDALLGFGGMGLVMAYHLVTHSLGCMYWLAGESPAHLVHGFRGADEGGPGQPDLNLLARDGHGLKGLQPRQEVQLTLQPIQAASGCTPLLH